MNKKPKISKKIGFGMFIFLMFITACQNQDDYVPEDLKGDEHGTKVLIVEADESQIGEFVTYGDDFKGYLVRPEAEGKFPGVILIHEWWGLNQNIKNMAHDLAKEGFAALAVDLYDGRVATTPDDARKYATEVRNDAEKAVAHMKSAVAFLKEKDFVENKVGSLGWCFGGGMSLQLALNEKMDATAIYYGSLETDKNKLSGIEWPVMGVFGEEDNSIPVATVNKFEESLNELNIKNEIYIYEGVGHAFANPSNPGHDAVKTADAWEKTVEFLNRNLKE